MHVYDILHQTPYYYIYMYVCVRVCVRPRKYEFFWVEKIIVHLGGYYVEMELMLTIIGELEFLYFSQSPCTGAYCV